MEKSRCGPFPVPSKKVIVGIVALLIVGLLLGFVLGYVTGWQIHRSPRGTGMADSDTTSVTTATPTVGFSSARYQQVLNDVTDEDILREIRDFEKDPIEPGTNASLVEVSRVRAQWTSYGYPTTVNSRPMLFPDTFSIALNQSSPFSTISTSTASPVAYSTSGSIMDARLVVVNYGTAADYANLAVMNFNISGQIAGVMLGGPETVSSIVRRAASEGAVGVIFFPTALHFPNIHSDASISVNAKLFSGDPLTPNLGVQPEGTYQIPTAEASEQTTIPAVVLPYSTVSSMVPSLGTETPLLAQSSNTFSMSVQYTYAVRNAATAILGVRGSPVADKFVFIGTHHDQMNPNSDPATGRAVHNTVLHTLTNAIQRGDWVPRRSLIFVSFDASTLDMGPREWLEENRIQYEERGVAYINLASAATGSVFRAESSPALNRLVTEAVSDAGLENIASMEVTGRGDHVPFTDYMGIPAIEMQYVNDTHDEDFRSVGSTEGTPDGTEWVTTLIRAHISAIMRICDAPILPYDLNTLSATMATGRTAMIGYNSTQYFDGLNDQVSALMSAIGKTSVMIGRFEGRKATANVTYLSDIKLRVINDVQQGVHRVFLHPIGVPMFMNGKVTPNYNNRNMLRGRLVSDGRAVHAFPGMVELFQALQSAPTPAAIAGIQRAIQIHLSEILASVDLAFDYLVRAVFDAGLFEP